MTRWNAYQRSSYEQLTFHRERRALAREDAARLNAHASGFSAIQKQQAIGMGDISSRIAMARIISKRV
ncbi:hypothetical protein [Devosia chinhatensis]|uniref:Uncharacterized protein n=1 Tax=Devosia chinhatensis TaxID=429727 RepID=A0A0F5FMG4_9HYPH|nr:hypothetical protein [Devosia chinhatensis]KKB10059.1 hypothetical protein VE26_09760 [Devosia chinhatensis]